MKRTEVKARIQQIITEYTYPETDKLADFCANRIMDYLDMINMLPPLATKLNDDGQLITKREWEQ